MNAKRLIRLTFIAAAIFAVLLFCLINTINSRIDFSKDKVFTLSPVSKSLLSNVSEKVQITDYILCFRQPFKFLS